MLVCGLLGAAFATTALALFALRLAGVALPFAIGLSTFFAALHHGFDPLLAVVSGVLIGILTLVAGQFVFARSRSVAPRAAVAAVFVIPAGVAGYHVAADIVSLTTASQMARLIVGMGGAVTVGWAALRHLVSGAQALAMPARRAETARPDHAGWGGHQLPDATRDHRHLT